MKRTVIVIGSLAESLINFRGALLADMVRVGCRVVACAPNASVETKSGLARIGVEFRVIPFDRTGLNLVKDVQACIALVRLMREVRPDIVFGYTIKPVVYGSIVARLTGTRKIFSMITGLGYAFSSKGAKQKIVSLVAQMLYRFSLRCNAKVFFQNPDDQADFERMNLLKSSDQAVQINGSGVDIKSFVVTPFPVKISFLLIARLLKDKGITEYVEAARAVKSLYPQVSFRLAGWIDDNPNAISKGQLDCWINDGLIEFLGRLSDVRSAISACSVYVLPSYYREGTPRTVLEAMAMGRPIITTDAPGCRETVRNGLNGFLVPTRDSKSLAQAMLKFIESKALIPQMGARSRELAVQKYDVDKVNAVLLSVMGLLHEAVV